MNKKRSAFDKTKFKMDFLVNLISVFVLGVSGVVVNIVIARFYSDTDLGVFNQTYAIYVIFSQLALVGIQVSVLKHIAQYSQEKMECDRIFTSAFFLCFLSASFIVFLLFLSKGLIGDLLKSRGVVSALPYILVGVWCFVFNKLFMGILNGFEHMKAYAFFSFLRGIGLLIGIFGATIFRIEGYKLPVIFSLAECIVIVPLYFYSKKLVCFVGLSKCKDWIKMHLFFGVKSLGIGLVTQLHTRVDILILGIFVSDRVVGIYSLAAMLIEWLFQIPFVLRRIFDPKLTRLIYNKQMKNLQYIIHKGVRGIFYRMLIVYGISICLFPTAMTFLTKRPDFTTSWKIFLILAIGAAFQSGYLPFSGILVLGGYPGYYSIFILLLCVTNIILNIMLIPSYGIYGAAFATAVSYVLFVVYLKLFVSRILRIKI